MLPDSEASDDLVDQVLAICDALDIREVLSRPIPQKPTASPGTGSGAMASSNR